jgi:hypothetical protein
MLAQAESVRVKSLYRKPGKELLEAFLRLEKEAEKMPEGLAR